jgi:hypothetical protein
MSNKLLTIQEVATMVGSSVQTINGWYKWKFLNPDEDLAELLPDYTRMPGGRNTRYWQQADVWRLIQFKQSITQGRNGFMGAVTQKYVKKKPKFETEIQEEE